MSLDLLFYRIRQWKERYQYDYIIITRNVKIKIKLKKKHENLSLPIRRRSVTSLDFWAFAVRMAFGNNTPLLRYVKPRN